MDNKQATPIKETDLAYLAGIIDGEGWVGLLKRQQKRWITYKPALRVTNTDANIINKVYEIWQALDVTGHIYENEQDPSVSNGKQVMYIQLNKQSVIKKVLEAVIPYLVAKKARAIMLLRFVDKTVDREEAFQAIKTANRKGLVESSEAIREAPINLGEDMVHTAANVG